MTKISIPHPQRKRTLILIDLQEGFLTADNRWIIPNIKKVITEGNYDLLVEAIFHAEPGSLWDKQVKWTFPLVQTVPEIKNLLDKDTILITKTTKSAFKGNKDLLAILRQNDIEEVHIIGLDTNDCVFATAQEYFDLDFFTYVIEECTASGESEEYREAALKILRYLKMTNHADTIETKKIIES